jgi:hypothetical protein
MNKSLKSIYEIERKIDNSVLSYPVNKIKYNKFYKNIIAASYDDGIMDIIKLSDDMCDNKYDEINKLNKIINSFTN